MAKRTSGPIDLTVVNADQRDVMGDVARVDISHRPFARAGQVIVIRHGRKKAHAVARGASSAGKNSIALESAIRAKLGVRINQQATLNFEEAGYLTQLRWAWNASDAMARIAARLAVVSVGLGVLGLLLGIISLIVTFYGADQGCAPSRVIRTSS